MSIMLGNLQINQIEERSGVVFPEELKSLMAQTYCPSATVPKGNFWHCFNIPFVLLCGSTDMSKIIYHYLKDFEKDFKEPLKISIVG